MQASRHSADTGPLFSIGWYSLSIISVLYSANIVCYTAVFSVVTQRSSPLRDDTKNGCVADYGY